MSRICTECGANFIGLVCLNCGTQLEDQNLGQQEGAQTTKDSYEPNPYQSGEQRKKRKPKTKQKVGAGFIVSISIYVLITTFLRTLGGSYQYKAPEEDNVAVEDDLNYEAELPAGSDYNDEQIEALYADPKNHSGKHFKLSGIVISNPDTIDDKLFFQMLQDVPNNANDTIVVYQGNPDIKEGDYVTLDGVISNEYVWENSYGDVLDLPTVIASKVEISTYQNVVLPADETLLVDQEISQHGYKVILDKIEFSNKETRVYVTVKNEGKSNFSVFSSSVKIIQNTKLFEEQWNFDAAYPEIQSNVKPGSDSSGIICFPALDSKKDLSLYIGGFSDNWEEEIKDYEFTVINEK